MGVPTHTHTHSCRHTHAGFDELKVRLGHSCTPRVATRVHACTRVHAASAHTHTRPGGSADRQDRSKATPGGNLNFKTRDQSLGADIIISHTRSEPRLG